MDLETKGDLGTFGNPIIVKLLDKFLASEQGDLGGDMDFDRDMEGDLGTLANPTIVKFRDNLGDWYCGKLETAGELETTWERDIEGDLGTLGNPTIVKLRDNDWYCGELET